MFESVIIPLLQSVLTVVVPILVAYLVRYLQAHIGAQQTIRLSQDVLMIVHAVEQMASNGVIPKADKFKYAFQLIHQWYPNLTDDRITHYIEGVVGSMNQSSVALQSATPLLPDPPTSNPFPPMTETI